MAGVPRLSAQHSLSTAARIFIDHTLSVHICEHMREKGLIGNFQRGLAKGKTFSILGQKAGEINTLEVLTETAGLEHSLSKGGCGTGSVGADLASQHPTAPQKRVKRDHRGSQGWGRSLHSDF